ncbi:hypothetical protein Dimus_024470 [Dionaea muscipula]
MVVPLPLVIDDSHQCGGKMLPGGIARPPGVVNVWSEVERREAATNKTKPPVNKGRRGDGMCAGYGGNDAHWLRTEDGALGLGDQSRYQSDACALDAPDDGSRSRSQICSRMEHVWHRRQWQSRRRRRWPERGVKPPG